jgi:hypothetical protein
MNLGSILRQIASRSSFLRELKSRRGADQRSIEKMMVTIVSNPTGFYRIIALPKGMKFNADYYISHILDPLAEWRRSQVGALDRRLHVHADNAHPHTAKKVTELLVGNSMKKAPRPPYSPDLAPCDFSLFVYINDRLADASFEEPN